MIMRVVDVVGAQLARTDGHSSGSYICTGPRVGNATRLDCSGPTEWPRSGKEKQLSIYGARFFFNLNQGVTDITRVLNQLTA